MMEHELDILKDIKRVNAPIDIWDNIQAKLLTKDSLSKTWLWAIAAAFLILFCIELYLFKASFFQNDGIATIADTYDVSSNHLYHD